MFAVGPTVLAGGGSSFIDRLKEALKLPPIWAALAGLGVNVTQLSLPESFTQGVSLLGSAAIPIMLLSLGIQMQRSWVWAVGGAAARSFGLRLLVGPFIAYGAGRLLGLGSARPKSFGSQRRDARRGHHVRHRRGGQGGLRGRRALGNSHNRRVVCSDYRRDFSAARVKCEAYSGFGRGLMFHVKLQN